MCIYICICDSAHMYMHIRECARAHTCKYAYTSLHIHTYIYTYIHIYIHVDTYAQMCMRSCKCAHMHKSAPVELKATSLTLPVCPLRHRSNSPDS